MRSTEHFDYDLHIVALPGTNSRTMICCHGYGANYQLAENLRDLDFIESTLVSFNFPDHDLEKRAYDPHKASFGTIHEVLPALYVLKKYVIDQELDVIDLYGISAGGGAIVNLIAVLHTSTYDLEIQHIGIDTKEKKKILQAIQNGFILLDAPLKSVEEIIDFRGSTPELEILAAHYHDHHFRPIDTLKNLKGLALNVLLYFENPDEIIFNRDDNLYIERLKEANILGTTSVVVGNESGHCFPHSALWQLYAHKLKAADSH